MSIASEKERLQTVKDNFVVAINYHGKSVDSTELFSTYPQELEDVPFFMVPETVNYNYGYVGSTGWVYEDNEGKAKNPIDIYKVEKGHSYFVMLGGTIGARFRVCTVSEDIRLKTSGTSLAQKISISDAPSRIYPVMGNYTNPDYNNAKTPFFKSTVDGWLLIQKDNDYNINIKSYVFDIDTPLTVEESFDYTLSEDLFDISNGIVTLKTTADKTTINGRKGVPETVDGQTVTGLGDSCFEGCSELATLDLPSTITSMGDSALKGTSLIYFNPPSTVTSIGDTVVKNNTALRESTIPNTVSSFGSGLFSGCTSLTTATIRSQVTTLDATFYGCIRLHVVSLPSTLTTVTNGAFYNCRSIVSFTPFSNLVTIELSSFEGCTGLTTVPMSNTVTTIGQKAFKNCTGLTDITIPSSVTTLGAEAFYGCSSLQSITVECTTPPQVDSTSFENTNDCPIIVPAGTLSTYQAQWSDYSSRLVESQSN